MEAEDKFMRLPTSVKPLIYNIYMKCDVGTFEFNGTETITLEITEPTDTLTLHSHQLALEEVSVEFPDGKVEDIPNDRLVTDEKNQFITVHLLRHVSKGETLKLNITFSGKLNDAMKGFYRSAYKDGNGEEKYIASTQFESTFARWAFPCWDELIYKAKFDITFEIDPELKAISNMNIVEEKMTENGKKIVKFARTPLMSTNLVAFAVGDFTSIHTKSAKAGKDIRVYVVNIPGKIEHGKYALEVASKAFDWYIEWFGVPMPIPKCDLVGIPNFSWGAMENWGMVTFRELQLLIDPEKSSRRQIERTTLIVAHELSHFWFGNLVTMKWWSDLWLKEGFANFMEYVFTDKNYPMQKCWLSFVCDELTGGLFLDALRNSHPIEVVVESQNQLEEIYDQITYQKSSSINRMLYYYLGEEIFQKGLHTYLKKFQLSNAQTSDLWDSLSAVSKQDIKSMMSTWTAQMGFPLVSVVQRRLDGNRRELLFKQSRFLADGGPDETKSIWHIPIGITSASSPNEVTHKVLLKDSEATFTLDGIKSDEWVKLNAGSTGFFRVKYSEEMFEELVPAFRSRQMPVIDRFNFVNDFLALVTNGEASVVRFLALLNGCEAETEYIVWQAIDAGLSMISNILTDVDGEFLELSERFNQFVISLLIPQVKKLTWTSAKNEDNHTTLLRALIIGRLIKAGHVESLKIAQLKFREYVDNEGPPLDANLREAIFIAIARSGDKNDIKKLRTIYETSNFNEIQCNCLVAMGQICDPAELELFYDYAILEKKVRSQDLMHLFSGSASTMVGKIVSWNFFKKHVRKLIELYGSVNSIVFQRCLKHATYNRCTEQMAADLENFVKSGFEPSEQKILDRTVRQLLECIRINSRLRIDSVDALDSFLAQ